MSPAQQFPWRKGRFGLTVNQDCSAGRSKTFYKAACPARLVILTPTAVYW